MQIGSENISLCDCVLIKYWSKEEVDEEKNGQTSEIEK